MLAAEGKFCKGNAKCEFTASQNLEEQVQGEMKLIKSKGGWKISE